MSALPRYTNLNARFWLIVLATFFMRIGQFMVLPFFAILITQHFHSSAVVVGAILGIGPLCFSLFSFNAGHLTDKFGCKSIIIASLLFGAIAFACMFFLHFLLAYFFLSMALGICRSLFNAATRAYIFLVVPKKMFSLAYGANYIAINVGMATGLLVGTLFAALNSNLLFALIALGYFVLGFVLLVVLPHVQGNPKNVTITFASTIKTILNDKRLIILVVAMIFMWIPYSQLDSILPIDLVHIKQNPAIVYAKIIVINAIITSCCQPFVSKWVSNVRLMIQASIGVSLLFLGYLCYLIFSSLLWFKIGMGIMSLGEVFLLPMVDIWIGSLATGERAGAYYASGNFYMLGSALGPIIGGWIYDNFGFKAVFIMCLILTALILPLFKLAVPKS